MVYIIFLLLLFIFCFINKSSEKYFKFLFAFFSFFLCIRYGQGLDYFNYKDFFTWVPTNYKSFFTKSYTYGSEPFYYLLNVFAKKHKLGYSFVVIISALITTFFHFKTISEYSKSFFISFFILYANYFVYLNGAVRQGMAMSITTYAFLNYADKHNLKRFLFLCFLAMMCHTSAIIGILFPLFLKISRQVLNLQNVRNYLWIAIISIILGPILFNVLLTILGMIYHKYNSYRSWTVSFLVLLPLGIRFFCALIVLSAYRKYRCNVLKFEENLISIYLFGSILYNLLYVSSLGSRVTDYFTIFEVIIFANLFPFEAIRKLNLKLFLVLFLFSALFIKEIYTNMVEGKYYSKNPLYYPYISIFNKEKILIHKDLSSKSTLYLFSENQ